MENNKSVYETINQYCQKQMEIWKDEKESQEIKHKQEMELCEKKIKAVGKSMENLRVLVCIVLIVLVLAFCVQTNIDDIIQIFIDDSRTIIKINSDNTLTLMSIFIFPYLLFLITFIINQHVILYREKVTLKMKLEIYKDSTKNKSN